MRRFIIERDGQQIGQGVQLADGRAFATVLGDRYDIPGMARVDPEIFAGVGKAIGADVRVEFIDPENDERLGRGSGT